MYTQLPPCEGWCTIRWVAWKIWPVYGEGLVKKDPPGPFVGLRGIQHRTDGHMPAVCMRCSAAVLGFSGQTELRVPFSSKTQWICSPLYTFSCLSAAGAGQHVHIPWSRSKTWHWLRAPNSKTNACLDLQHMRRLHALHASTAQSYLNSFFLRRNQLVPKSHKWESWALIARCSIISAGYLTRTLTRWSCFNVKILWGIASDTFVFVLFF